MIDYGFNKGDIKDKFADNTKSNFEIRGNMIIEAISKILESVAKYAWGVFVVCLFVILLPVDSLKYLGMETIKLDYLGFWWLGLIFSAAIWSSSIFSRLANWYYRIRKKSTNKAIIIKRLRTLDQSEYMWIVYCLLNNVQTLSATAIHQTANSLLNKGIVTQGSGSILNLPFHIQDFIWEYLQEHREDFLPQELSNDKDKLQILDSFVRSLRKPF